MSKDKSVTKDLMETLADGRDGFTKAAEKLDEAKNSEVASLFRQYAQQRSAFYDELEAMASSYGDDIDESGSIGGALHRGWMAVKDALSGSSAKGVIEAAEQGEDHAVEEYEDALKSDISPGLRAVVERQYGEVKATHDRVRDLKANFKDS